MIKVTYDLHNDEKMSVGNIMTEYEEKFSASVSTALPSWNRTNVGIDMTRNILAVCGFSSTLHFPTLQVPSNSSSGAMYWFICRFMNYKPRMDVVLCKKFFLILQYIFVLIKEIIKANFAVIKMIMSSRYDRGPLTARTKQANNINARITSIAIYISIHPFQPFQQSYKQGIMYWFICRFMNYKPRMDVLLCKKFFLILQYIFVSAPSFYTARTSLHKNPPEPAACFPLPLRQNFRL